MEHLDTETLRTLEHVSRKIGEVAAKLAPDRAPVPDELTPDNG
ncbi:hypothetical protein ACFQ0B_49205 [Nonomuraea thailandensis]